jgi:hypothetical protein
MNVATLGAFLRMGGKYGIDHLREAAISRLEREYPHAYEDFCSALTHRGSQFEPHALEYYDGALLDLVNLAHEHDVISALPLLLYFAHDLPLDQLACGIARSGSEATGDAVLHPATFKLVMRARQALVEHQAVRLTRWTDKHMDKCTSHLTCKMRKQAILRSLYVPNYRSVSLLPWDEGWNEGLCRACALASKRSHENSRNQTWRVLPTLVGLPDWEDLTSSSGTGDETQIL